MITSATSQTIFLGIRYYSVFMALAMIFGSLATYFIAKKYYKDINLDCLLDLFPILIISGIIGARLYYVLLDFNYFSSNPIEIFMINHGGISIHGALIGGFTGALIFSKIKKINLLKYADVLSYGLILGQAIGRMGNYFNSEAFGRPTDIFCKMYVAPQFRPIKYINENYFHPTFLYEIICNLLIFCILFFIIRKIAKNKEGIIFFSYLILYSFCRFFTESLRIDSILNINTMPVAQIASILLIVTGISGIFLIGNFSKS